MLKLENKEEIGEVTAEFRYDVKGILNKLLGNGFILTSLLLAFVVIRAEKYKGILLAIVVWLLGLYVLNIDKHYRETTIKFKAKGTSLYYDVLRKNAVVLRYHIHLKQIKYITLKVTKIFSPGKQTRRFRMNKLIYSFEILTGDYVRYNLFPDSNFKGNIDQTIKLKKLFEYVTGKEVQIHEKDKAVIDEPLLRA